MGWSSEECAEWRGRIARPNCAAELRGIVTWIFLSASISFDDFWAAMVCSRCSDSYASYAAACRSWSSCTIAAARPSNSSTFADHARLNSIASSTCACSTPAFSAACLFTSATFWRSASASLRIDPRCRHSAAVMNSPRASRRRSNVFSTPSACRTTDASRFAASAASSPSDDATHSSSSAPNRSASTPRASAPDRSTARIAAVCDLPEHSRAATMSSKAQKPSAATRRKTEGQTSAVVEEEAAM